VKDFTLEQVLAIASFEGIPTSPRNPHETYMWNGKDIGTSPKDIPGFLTDADPNGSLVHEMCHYLVAPPERRIFPEYGLGWSGLTRERSERIVPKNDHSDEKRALVLDMRFRRAMGVAIPLAKDRIWEKFKINEIEVELWLASKGLLVRGIPRFCAGR
jgi:hypothetical protein